MKRTLTLAALAFYEEPRIVTLCMAQDYVEPADLASRIPNTFTNHLNYYGIASKQASMLQQASSATEVQTMQA